MNTRRNKIIFPIIACFIFSTFSIFLLYNFSDKLNHSPNSFIRLFPPRLIDPAEKKLNIHNRSYYIAGVTSQKIYLGNFENAEYLLTTDYNLSDTQNLRLFTNDSNSNTLKGSAIVTIDSPDIYITQGSHSLIMYGKLLFPSILRVMDTVPFFTSAPVSPTSYVLRMYNERFNQTVLVKAMQATPLHYSPIHVLEKQLDGTFCTDGMLNYDSDRGYLVYVYYYRNQYLLLDTNLNLLFKGNTIDTVSQAKIKLSNIASEGIKTLATPPLIINKKSCISDNFLFVNSNLLANNEQKKLFDECSVIDVYSLKDRSYKFSFYLPDVFGKKISGFRVFNKTLIAIYDHYILTYQLNF